MTLPEIIKTERLHLRPFTFADVDDVYGYASDPEWSLYLAVPYPYTYQHAEQFIATRKLDDPTKEKVWAIELDGAVIGGISLRSKAEDYAICELGWSVSQPNWGKGLMTEVAQTMRDTTFSRLPKLHRLYARADLRNTGSWRVMEKIGMQREAVLRQHAKFRGEWVDEVWYGILQPEWDAAQGTI
ncbi:MAG: GNAT family N-acetyltransferase [Anaerolineae bacterium]